MGRGRRAVLALAILAPVVLAAFLFAPVGCFHVDTGPRPPRSVPLTYCEGFLGNHVPFRTAPSVAVLLVTVSSLVILAVILVAFVARRPRSAQTRTT